MGHAWEIRTGTSSPFDHFQCNFQSKTLSGLQSEQRYHYGLSGRQLVIERKAHSTCTFRARQAPHVWLAQSALNSFAIKYTRALHTLVIAAVIEGEDECGNNATEV